MVKVFWTRVANYRKHRTNPKLNCYFYICGSKEMKIVSNQQFSKEMYFRALCAFFLVQTKTL